MLVQHITLTIQYEKQTFRADQHDRSDAIKIAVEKRSSRLAFGGRTHCGMSNIVLEPEAKLVSGHGIDPIPPALESLLECFPLEEGFQALDVFADGRDVFIGTRAHGIALRWDGDDVQIYGTGKDLENAGSRPL